MNYEMRFTKEEMKSVLEKYYMEYEDFDGKIQIDCIKELAGYGMAEQDSAVVSVILNGSFQLLGTKAKTSRILSEEEVGQVFTTLLEKEGYEVEKAHYDASLKDSWKGYGVDEYRTTEPNFNGFVVDVKKEQKIKRK